MQNRIWIMLGGLVGWLKKAGNKKMNRRRNIIDLGLFSVWKGGGEWGQSSQIMHPV